MQFLKQLAEKWADWLGDRDMELSLRKHLTEQGFYGEAAKFRQVRLMAIQRPGWVQVYTFTADARSRLNEAEPMQRLFGIVRQDERYNRTEVQVFAIRSQRTELFEQWSRDLVRLRRPAADS